MSLSARYIFALFNLTLYKLHAKMMIELEFNKFNMLTTYWHPEKRKAREGTNKSLAFVIIEGAL